MINDSVPWRVELANVARRLRKRENQKRWTERTSFLLERDLMIGMFAVRRLIESGKCSSRLPKRKIPVQLAVLRGREPDFLDRWSPWEHYDVDNLQPTELSMWSMVQQFVHSFVLVPDVAEDGVVIAGIFVGSDFSKRSHIYRVSWPTIVELYEYIAVEEVTHWSMKRGVNEFTRFTVSQHDLVELGLAEYDNPAHDYVRLLDAIHDDVMIERAFPELAEWELAELRNCSWSNMINHRRDVSLQQR